MVEKCNCFEINGVFEIFGMVVVVVWVVFFLTILVVVVTFFRGLVRVCLCCVDLWMDFRDFKPCI